MKRRPALALSLPLLLLAAHAVAKGTPATTVPLAPPPATPSAQLLQRQTGMVVIVGDQGQRTIIRSVEPDSLVGGDRLDFATLDTNGDGVVDRREAATADRNLAAEFGNVDANGDGTLDREELVGWIL